jgi:hypothetical protein
MNARNHILQHHLTNYSRLTIIVCLLFGFSFIQAQTPGLSYQAVIHDSNNEVVANQNVQLQFTISSSNDDIELYTETISTTTDIGGMVAVTIGTASSNAVNFKSLSWDGTPKKLRVELSTDDGSTFHELGEQEILYLPQAVDSSNEQTSTFQNITINGTITDGDNSVGSNGDVMTTDGTKIVWKKPTLSWSIQEQTSSTYTAGIEDGTVLATPSNNSAIMITLPSITAADNGTVLSVIRSNDYLGNGDNLTVKTSETIPRTFNLNVGYQGLLFQAFGGEWRIIQKL